jgi:hypothetical protein
LVCLSIAVSALAAGCATSGETVHRRPVRPEVFVNLRAVSLDRLVARTAGGREFLVPARLNPASVDFVHPASVNVTPYPPFPPRTTPPGIDAFVTATIERPDNVEIVATGPARRHVDLTWEETCGSRREGKRPAEAGGSGGQGEQRAQLPTVLSIKLPQWSSGEDSCYVSAVVYTSRFERGLSIELVNY